MSENCASLEAWGYRPAAFPESCWITESFTRENEALTKALQFSLSDDSSGSTPVPSTEALSAATSSILHSLLPPEPAPLPSNPDSKRGRNSLSFSSPSGKITKRKSRASKRSPTTYITADPANFRQMVQQVTGIRFGDPILPLEPVLKPEPQRPGASKAIPYQSCLPTLDTSAFLLDRAAVVPSASFGQVVEGPAFDFEPFSSFPTLESWSAM